MDPFNRNENNNQDTALVPTSGGTTQTDEQFSGPLWSQLPPNVIEKIYSVLGRRDQAIMSMVCRSWHQEYSSPSLWRRVEFRFSDFRDNTELCPAVILARRYGPMFHHVKVHLDRLFERHLLVLVLTQTKLFCEALTRNSQLISISFKVLQFLRFVNGSLLADVCQVILNLLKSQNGLQHVEFKDCRFEKTQAEEILNAIFQNNYKTLRFINLKNFYNDHNGVESTDSTLDDYFNFKALMNLETLHMDYTQMFVSMMMSFYEHTNKVDMTGRKGYLKEVRLRGFYRGILHQLPWKYFRNIFPGLKIDLTLFAMTDSNSLNAFIVPHMPLISLRFVLGSPVKIGPLLHHITSCELNKCLEIFAITIYSDVPPNFASDLIHFTNICSNLKILKLEIEHPGATELDAIFNSWRENRPASLYVVKISVMDIKTEAEKNIYAHLNDTYAPLLKPLELNLSSHE